MSNKILEECCDLDMKIKTDNEYARNYDKWRKKEELNKLRTKYGEDNFKLLELEDMSSSSSDDDDDGEQLTIEVEKQFFKTLSYIKNKDPCIYDNSVRFFDKISENIKNNHKRKERPLYINDYERELLLKTNGQFGECEQGDQIITKSPTYVEEQQKIKENFKRALDNVSDEGSDVEWGGIMKIRQQSEDEKLKEEAEYKKWLAGQKDEINDKKIETELKPLKDYWNNPSLDDGEKFLRDYILKKKFLSEKDEDYIPTYEEIVHDSDKDLSEDENNIDKQEEFEHKYNFRFEEPDQEFIKRYPRTLTQSVRNIDDRRKIKRAEVKDRKQKEKQQKRDELKKLRKLKQKEIEEKIEKLKEITGNDNIGFKDEDFDEDFDPEIHDKRMQSLFNDKFYEIAEGDQKPEFQELDEYLELENWDKWIGDDNNRNNTEYVPHYEDEAFNMDADYEPQTSTNKFITESTDKKKRRRKSLFATALSHPKPVFDPHDKTYEEYLDEYYQFDCEDIIGDLPCRFKYRKVIPNNFGLSIEEILMANDRELNRWCSLKKAIQHRPDHVEKYDQIAYTKKAQNFALKRKILPSLFIDDNDKNIKQNGSLKNKKLKYNLRDLSHTVVKDVERINKTPIKNENITTTVQTKEQNVKKNVINKTGDSSSEYYEKCGRIVNTGDKIKKIRKKSTVNNSICAKILHEKRKYDLQMSPNERIPLIKTKKNYYNEAEQRTSISDARLSAYGINPKKFKNKLKHAMK